MYWYEMLFKKSNKKKMIDKKIREYMSAISKRTLVTMTVDERKNRARKASSARWKKHKEQVGITKNK